jgi:DNA ligase-1
MSARVKPRGPFEPMLAERKHPDLEKLDIPIVVSPKLDGWRIPIYQGQALTRSLKPPPNPFVRECLSRMEFAGLDGEVIVGSPTAENCYDVTDSAMKREYGEPDFKFFVFDDFSEPDLPYLHRMEALRERQHALRDCERLVFHDWLTAKSVAEIEAYEDKQLQLGYEGLILRGLYAPYKFGRSTMKEGGMLKLKRWTDAEFLIVGVEEMMHNENEAYTNEKGNTQRSKKAEGMVPAGMLGALICLMPDGVTTFTVGGGPGLTLKRRKELWDIRDTLPGQWAKVKYFAPGTKIRPRMPKLIGLRSPLDMSR